MKQINQPDIKLSKINQYVKYSIYQEKKNTPNIEQNNQSNI